MKGKDEQRKRQGSNEGWREENREERKSGDQIKTTYQLWTDPFTVPGRELEARPRTHCPITVYG